MCEYNCENKFLARYLLYISVKIQIKRAKQNKGETMRIENHPVLTFETGKELSFTYNGVEMKGYESDTIASALHANGIKELSHSEVDHRPRGFYCAIGNCSSCLMEVDGEPNVRVCIVPLKEGMDVRTQVGKGELK